MNKLCIVISGTKQSGKNTLTHFIISRFLNRKLTTNAYYVLPDGMLARRGGLVNNTSQPWARDGAFAQITNDFVDIGVKVYSFADPLKQFCMDVFGIPRGGCYGTDAEKNEIVPHILWENFPRECRPTKTKWNPSVYREFSGEVRPSSYTEELGTGPMTAREIMQAFGTDICRRIYGDCWAAGTYNSIRREGHPLSIVCDARFPNEVSMGETVGAKTIRLGRRVYQDSHPSETALNDYPLDKYTVYLDNNNLTIEETSAYFAPIIDSWFEEAGLFPAGTP